MPNIFNRCLIGVFLLVDIDNVQATMRCGQRIVDVGELTVDVIRKCGEPASREVFNPVVGQDGQVVRGAVTVENWVYETNHGMSRYLRFIDGKLVEIRSKPDR
jgi:hypothetical protein